jgi:site-specific DNA-cytosine methylase
MADEPVFTMRAAQNNPRAFIADVSNTSRESTIRLPQEPVFSITASIASRESHICTQLSHGRVVAMTPRCLARFQSFPDAYELPESKALAAKGLGNAVPPLMMQRIYEGLITC